VNRLAAGLRTLLRSVADFVFPPLCWGCDEEAEDGLICESCRLLLVTSEMDVCPGCGRPCEEAQAGCGRCEQPLLPARVRALGRYQEQFRNLVHALKYSHKTALAGVLGPALAALAAQDAVLRKAEVVCAVPLHPARLRERGYNQSDLLARAVGAGLGLPVVEPIVRRKNTRTQTARRGDEQRRKNLDGAFAPKPGSTLEGRRVLLVDDVMTSGATLNAACRALLEAGAGPVLGLVIAAPAASKAEPRGFLGRLGTARRRRASPVRRGAG
jgi:ComF family protein